MCVLTDMRPDTAVNQLHSVVEIDVVEIDDTALDMDTHTHFIGRHKRPQTHLRRCRINSEHGLMHTGDISLDLFHSVILSLSIGSITHTHTYKHPPALLPVHVVHPQAALTPCVPLCVCHIRRKISINLSKRHVPLSLFSLAASEPSCKHTCHTGDDRYGEHDSGYTTLPGKLERAEKREI